MEGLVAVQLASPSGVAGLRRTPCDVPGMYVGYPRSGCGPGGRALLCSFLGPPQCIQTVG
jgi:hypothetical protein